MNQTQRHIFYEEQFSIHAGQADAFKKKLHGLGTLRLAIFIFAFLSFFIFKGSVLICIVALALIIFLWLVKLGVNVRYQRDKHRKIAELNRLELNVLKGDWSGFANGTEFINSKHAYSSDMDLFGEGSFYQLINRTVSAEGANRLAERLSVGSSTLVLDHAAIEELKQHMAWNQGFCAEGLLSEPADFRHDIRKVKDVKVGKHVFAESLRAAIPVCSITMAILFGIGIVSSAIFLMYASFVLIYIGSGLKHTNLLAAELGSVANVTKIRRRQMDLVSNLTVENELFRTYIAERMRGDESLQKALVSLERLQERIDYRMNLPVGVLLNIFLAWDLQLLHQYKQWQKNYSKDFDQHLEMFPALEVWVSGAIYSFNNPESVFATIDEHSTPKIMDLKHPFVAEESRKGNSLSFLEGHRFLIITGPNMAGKSTFLRSVGLAFICANAGFPVLATSCQLPNRKLYSSMRTSDDLNAKSSYFHAELSRLKSIMDAMDSGEKVFVILDEILKGTNSIDKEKGSAIFLQKIKRLGCMGIIATHDLSLCNLANDDSDYFNQSFDSVISNNELSFDYKLRDGVCKNMNATFLLTKMGLIDAENSNLEN
ncbi:MAG: MutS-related protein [Flavobacteriia bacterium]